MTADDWRALPHLTSAAARQTEVAQHVDADPANAGIRREPELPEHEEIVAERTSRRPRIRCAGG